MSDLIEEHGILKELTKSLVERALQSERTAHLGHAKHSVAGNNTGNSRNGDFDTKAVAKNQTHFDGLDEQILPMCAKGMSGWEISEHIRDLYHTEVSTEFISRVTDSELDVVYPIVFRNAIRVKIRDEGQIRSTAIYNAIGVTMEGHKMVLGL